MGTVLSIRGTNGSGKSSIARRFLPSPLTGGQHGGPVNLNWYPSPTKKEPGRQKRVEGYGRDSKQLGCIGIVGPYKTSCGGLDQVQDFEVSRGAISYMLDTLCCEWVIAEGLLASGVYGSWGKYSELLRSQGHIYAFCYLNTPLEVCKERIKMRQEAAGKKDKVINWQLVEDKFNSVRGNRDIALSHGEVVYDLPYLKEVEAVIDIMMGKGDEHRVRA